MSETEHGAHAAPEDTETPVNVGLLGVPFEPDPTVWDGHNPGVLHFKRHFAFAHLSPELAPVSIEFARLAETLARYLESGPELSSALRHLWEAKNSAVLQLVIDRAAEAALAAASPEV